jgi:predicted phage tail protein
MTDLHQCFSDRYFIICVINLITMSEHHIPDGLTHEVWQLFTGGHDSEEITARLRKRDIDEETIEQVVKTVREMRQARGRRQGLRAAGVGAVLLVMAFFVTYILSANGLPSDWALYGLTTLGAAVLFVGMMLYMG